MQFDLYDPIITIEKVLIPEKKYLLLEDKLVAECGAESILPLTPYAILKSKLEINKYSYI